MASIRQLMGLDQANFSTVESDFQVLVEKIFSNQNILKMLYYGTVDCLSKSDITDNEILNEISKENVRIVPDIKIPINQGAYLVITFDNFSPNSENPEYIDNFIFIDVLCPIDLWIMDSYMLRPFKIMHELNKMIDKSKFNGIGKVNFIGANLLNLGDYSGYQLAYSVINDV